MLVTQRSVYVYKPKVSTLSNGSALHYFLQTAKGFGAQRDTAANFPTYKKQENKSNLTSVSIDILLAFEHL